MDSELKVMWGVGAAVAALLVLLVYATYRENVEWQAFSVKHECRAVAHITGDVFTTVGVGSNGAMVVGTGSTPSKTGWACNNGITYYR